MGTSGNNGGGLSELNRIYLWSIRHHRLRVTHACMVRRVAHFREIADALRTVQGV